MIYKELKCGYERCFVRIFDSSSDVKRFIDNGTINDCFESRRYGLLSVNASYDFSNTRSYSEAEDLYIHGWDYMAGKLTNALKTENMGVKQRNKNAYGVAGYQACVPRYLQGMPDSMIYGRRVPVKDKIVTVNKSIGYAYKVKTDEIIRESVKVLQLVRDLESKGYRVNLNVLLGSSAGSIYTFQKINIKKASQKLNIKQTAFPLVNPSMLRRISVAIIERSKECNTIQFSYGYGRPINEHNCFKDIMKGEYFIPSIVSEQEITDIEKYRVE